MIPYMGNIGLPINFTNGKSITRSVLFKNGSFIIEPFVMGIYS